MIVLFRYPSKFTRYASSIINGKLLEQHWKSACNYTGPYKLKDASQLCTNTKLYEAACSLFPIKLIKLVHVGMSAMTHLLEDQTLNVHVVYLVRDPRPVMHSRMTTVDWCYRYDCYNVSYLCNSMDKDLTEFQSLYKRFPDRLHFVRYEDLCLNPNKIIKELMDEVKLDFDDNMIQFLSTHTNKSVDNPVDTHRITSKQVLKWVKEISSERLEDVQRKCSRVMQHFGYLPIASSRNVTIGDILKPIKLIP